MCSRSLDGWKWEGQPGASKSIVDLYTVEAQTSGIGNLSSGLRDRGLVSSSDSSCKVFAVDVH